MSVHLKIVHIIGKRIVRQLCCSVRPALFGKVGKRKGKCFNCLIPLTLLDLQKKIMSSGFSFLPAGGR